MSHFLFFLFGQKRVEIKATVSPSFARKQGIHRTHRTQIHLLQGTLKNHLSLATTIVRAIRNSSLMNLFALRQERLPILPSKVGRFSGFIHLSVALI